MLGKYIKKHMDVYNLMSSDDDSEMKVHFKLLQIDFGYVKKKYIQIVHVSFFLKR